MNNALGQNVLGTTKGLLEAYARDPDIFIMLTAGILSGASNAPLKGLGRGLLLFSAIRSADRYADLFAQSVTVFGSHIKHLTQVLDSPRTTVRSTCE